VVIQDAMWRLRGANAFPSKGKVRMRLGLEAPIPTA
jgi:hypothetical protein